MASVMLRRVSLPLMSGMGQRFSLVTIPEKHLDKFDPNNPNYTKFEVVNDPEVWSHVEKIVSPPKIAQCPTGGGPSGWVPPRLTKEEAMKLPYFVQRTRHHMLPVYMKSEIRGPRYITYIRKVQGDPWALRNEIKAYLEETTDLKEIITSVNELTQTVGVKGKFVDEIKAFLLKRGF